MYLYIWIAFVERKKRIVEEFRSGLQRSLKKENVKVIFGEAWVK
jgi:pyruvate/2-oxoglutarate dehydrogenase complex dihydrolipoamide dehydrogenase (E3) component